MEEIYSGFREYVPFIVPPTVLKHTQLSSPIIKSIWATSRDALLHAEEIYLLGYSCPASDPIVTNMLGEVCDSDKKLTVVDRAALEVASRLRQFVSAKIETKEGDTPIETLVTNLVQDESQSMMRQLRGKLDQITSMDNVDNGRASLELDLMSYEAEGGMDTVNHIYLCNPQILNHSTLWSTASYDWSGNSQNSVPNRLSVLDFANLIRENPSVDVIEVQYKDNHTQCIRFRVCSSPKNGNFLYNISLYPSVPISCEMAQP